MILCRTGLEQGGSHSLPAKRRSHARARHQPMHSLKVATQAGRRGREQGRGDLRTGGRDELQLARRHSDLKGGELGGVMRRPLAPIDIDRNQLRATPHDFL